MDCFIDEYRRGKRSPIDRAGIDIETVWALVRGAVLGRCVPVHNETVEVLSAGEKWLANPEEIMLVLSIERSVWVSAGMHEEAHPVIVERGQRTKPFNVLSRELDWACRAVAV